MYFKLKEEIVTLVDQTDELALVPREAHVLVEAKQEAPKVDEVMLQSSLPVITKIVLLNKLVTS